MDDSLHLEPALLVHYYDKLVLFPFVILDNIKNSGHNKHMILVDLFYTFKVDRRLDRFLFHVNTAAKESERREKCHTHNTYQGLIFQVVTQIAIFRNN